MSRSMIPYHGYDGYGVPAMAEQEPLDLVGLAALGDVSPGTLRRLEDLALKVQELRTMTPAVEQLSAATADAIRMRVSQTREPVQAEFEVSADHDCHSWFCGGHNVRIRGRIRVSGY